MKKAFGIGAAALLVPIAAVLIVPALVDLGFFKSTYLALLEESLHRRVDLGEVRLALLPSPSIRISNLKIFDGPVFPENTFFAAEQIRLRLKLWPLLTGRFDVTECIIDKPVIHLLKQPDGTFNYSDLADKKIPLAKTPKKAAAAKTPEPPVVPLVVPTRMRIKDGRLNFETKGQKPLRIDGIDLSLQDFSGDQPFPYHASFTYPGLKTIFLEGWLSYQESQSALQLKDNYLKVQDLVFPLQGNVSSLSTTPQVNLSLASDRVDAKTIFQILSVLGLAPPDTDVSGPMGLRLTLTGPSNRLLTQVHGRFQNVKVYDKRAAKGHVNGEILIKLPLGGGSVTRRIQGSGRLAARDGEFTNSDLIKKIRRAGGFIGLSKNETRQATTFKNLETEFTIANGFTDFKRIYLSNPQMEVNGAGTMTLDQPNLDLAIETALTAQASARARGSRTATLFKNPEGRIVVPLKITGPVENPTVNLNAEKLAQKGMSRSFDKSFTAFFNPPVRKK
ncbi:MAG TPA: AsmA-like C-terminal region-containing protein [Candidatus Binatia bacterium]|nr:AsmA-like C-terminal region-containing protein [Candidatus Binatia bacterium]